MAKNISGAPDSELKKSASLTLRKVIAYIVLIIISLLCLFWFYVLFVNSTRFHSDIQNGFSAIPGKAFVVNFKSLMKGTLPVFKGLRNSLVIAASTALLCTYFSTMTAFAIHAYDFKLKKFMFTFILMIMMIPTQVTALGFINLVDDLHMMNTYWPLIIPSIASPVTFFYLKQYMEGALPLSLIEAARIDGSGEFRTFNGIVLPLMKPAIAVQAIFAFVTSWNNYFTPSLILTQLNKKTLPILIAQLRSADWLKFDMGQVYMMITLSIFPVIIVYLILSKHIVSGIALGAVKE